MIDLKEQAGVAMNVRGQFSDPIADPKVTLGALAFANDLGRALVRMKCGQDVRPDSVRRATLLLAQLIRRSGRFDRSKFTGLDYTQARDHRTGREVERTEVDIIERFARRLLVEWIDDQCPRCEGRGVSGRSQTARPVVLTCPHCSGKRSICLSEESVPFFARADGRGPIMFRHYERCGHCLGRGEILQHAPKVREGRQICPDCDGNGRLPVDEAARSQAIGVPLPRYRRHWARHFRDMLALLDHVDGAVVDTMRRQMRG